MPLPAVPKRSYVPLPAVPKCSYVSLPTVPKHSYVLSQSTVSLELSYIPSHMYM